MSAKLCIAFRRKDKYEEATLRNRQELHHIMELFDSMFPTAPKRVVVDSENDEYHERWIGDQFYILFCINEDMERVVWSSFAVRGWISKCLRHDEFTMTYGTAFKFAFRDLKTLLHRQKKRTTRRRLALAMAFHQRLGRDSPLRQIGDKEMDLIKMIIN